MGGGSSKAQKKLDAQALHHNLEKFNPRTMELFRNLHITNETLNCLWKTFHAIASIDENDSSGRAYEDQEISYKEFHDYYDLGTNYFSEMVFNRMDYGASGEINFEEYVFSLWDFLTNDLHHFVFQVFDKDDSKFLTKKEMEQVVMVSYGVHFDEKHNAKADSATQKLLQKTALNAASIADLNQDDKITFKEYEFFTRKHGSVEHPGQEMQEKLCKANGGFKMWNIMRKERIEHHQTNSIHKILKKHSWERREKKRKRRAAKKEKAKAKVTDEEAAATKIQAVHRGRSTRKKGNGKRQQHDDSVPEKKKIGKKAHVEGADGVEKKKIGKHKNQ